MAFSINRSSKRHTNTDIETLRISDCLDVNVINPKTNDVLTWNGTNWISINHYKSFKISNCTDVNSSAPSVNDVLKWDGTQWKPCSLKQSATLNSATESESYQTLLKKNKSLETRIQSLENIIATLGQSLFNK